MLFIVVFDCHIMVNKDEYEKLSKNGQIYHHKK